MKITSINDFKQYITENHMGFDGGPVGEAEPTVNHSTDADHEAFVNWLYQNYNHFENGSMFETDVNKIIDHFKETHPDTNISTEVLSDMIPQLLNAEVEEGDGFKDEDNETPEFSPRVNYWAQYDEPGSTVYEDLDHAFADALMEWNNNADNGFEITEISPNVKEEAKLFYEEKGAITMAVLLAMIAQDGNGKSSSPVDDVINYLEEELGLGGSEENKSCHIDDVRDAMIDAGLPHGNGDDEIMNIASELEKQGWTIENDMTPDNANENN
jgi:hypothetical protein